MAVWTLTTLESERKLPERVLLLSHMELCYWQGIEPASHIPRAAFRLIIGSE